MTRLTYERRIQLLALAAGFPGSLIAMILLWHGSYSSGAVWTLAFLIFSLWLGFELYSRCKHFRISWPPCAKKTFRCAPAGHEATMPWAK